MLFVFSGIHGLTPFDDGVSIRLLKANGHENVVEIAVAYVSMHSIICDIISQYQTILYLPYPSTVAMMSCHSYMMIYLTTVYDILQLALSYFSAII